MELRVPKIFNLRTDPFERADITSNTYYDWMIDRLAARAGSAIRGADAADACRVPAPTGAGIVQRRQVMEKLKAGVPDS